MVSSASSAPRLVVAGSLNLDLVGRAPRIAAPGETVIGTTFEQFPGGKGGNQAVAAARLGAQVAFFGALGRDLAGTELLAGLQAEGIAVEGVRRVDAATGCALITVADSGENAITVLPGANRQVAGPDAAATLDAQGLLLQLEIELATNLAWAQAARQAGVKVILNAAPWHDAARTLLPLVDVLVVNQGELAALSGEDNVPAGLAAAAGLGPVCVVVTLGRLGCQAWERGLLHACAGQAVDVVDTTGAGDTFTGALAVALAEGRPLVHALRRANLAAALACTRAGARSAMPHAATLRAALGA